jgi:hypothetical protein
MWLARPVPTCTACCSRIGSRQILSNFQIRPNLRSPSAFGPTFLLSVQTFLLSRLLFCCPSSAVTILLICQIAQFEVPASVWSNFFAVRTYFFAVHATFLLSVYCRNNSVNFSNLRGPRQRLVGKRLCPRWTNVDYLLLRINFE